MGIEPTFSTWEADVLPLNYARHNQITIITHTRDKLRINEN